MKKLLALLALMPALTNAAGTTATVSWNHPTTRIDGVAIALTDIKETVVTWRRTSAGPNVGQVTVAGPAATIQVPGLVCGDFVFFAQTMLKTAGATISAESAPPAPYATGVNCVQANPPGAVTAQ